MLRFALEIGIGFGLILHSSFAFGLPTPLEILSSGVPIGSLKSAMGGQTYLLKKSGDFLFLVRQDGKHHISLIHPGEIRDAENGGLLYQGQAFFGQCIANHGDVFVSFQRERVDRRRSMQESVLVVEVEKDRLRENLITKKGPALRGVLKKVRDKSCVEIAGISRKSAQFRLPSRLIENEEPLIQPK